MVKINALAPEIRELALAIPEPKRGSAYLYCQFVKEIKKTLVGKGRSKKTVDEPVYCNFKSKSEKRYKRHYQRRHGAASVAKALAEQMEAAAKAANAQPPTIKVTDKRRSRTVAK